MPPAFFALIILEIGCLFLPRPAWTMSLLFTLPAIAGMIGTHNQARLFPIEMEVSQIPPPSPGLAWNHDPPSLSFPGSLEWTGGSHQHPAWNIFFSINFSVTLGKKSPCHTSRAVVKADLWVLLKIFQGM
jgi:hypothetical protein